MTEADDFTLANGGDAPRARRTPDERDVSAVEDDQAAGARDAAAWARDLAAGIRDVAAGARDLGDRFSDADNAIERLYAQRDRASAAVDRYEAEIDRHRAARYLQRTYRDVLTGALQRAAGRDQLLHEVARAHRCGSMLVVAFLDVDNLKQVNDEGGHDAGDVLLRTIGEALHEGLRNYDLIVRYGGDEFVCALPEASIPEAAARFDEVNKVLAMERFGGSLSVGLAELLPGDELDDLLSRADRALYEQRAKVRNPTRNVDLTDGRHSRYVPPAPRTSE